MILTLEKKKFAEAVHIVSHFAERGSATLPALSAILIISGDDGIKLRATNLEVSADLKLEGEKKGQGVVAIPARILEQISASFGGEGTITLEQNGDSLRIEGGHMRSTIKTVPYEDFPPLPFPESPKARVVLAGAVIKSLFSSIASCASVSTIRPELASIYLSIEGGVMTAVATDSFRLAEKKVPLQAKTTQSRILIPAKNALDIARALPDEEVIMSFDDHQCIFVFPGGTLATRLTNAVYPDYRQIIPKESVAEATVLRKDFESGVRRATIFSDTFQKIRVVFDPKGKSLSLHARNNDVGESSETIPGNISGNAVEFSFNHRYLSAFLPLSSAESIHITAAGVGRPLIMRGAGDPSFLYLVMPMNQ